MLKQGLHNIVAGPICDREAIAIILKAGEGNTVSLVAGGKTDSPAINQFGCGIALSAKVKKITDGKFVITGPMQTGLEVNLGPTAILETEQMELVLCSERWEPYDPGCFTHAGIDPTDKQFILLKSRQHFRAGFEEIANQIILAAGPGICSSDYSQFDFKNLQRPIYPIDSDKAFINN